MIPIHYQTLHPLPQNIIAKPVTVMDGTDNCDKYRVRGDAPGIYLDGGKAPIARAAQQISPGCADDIVYAPGYGLINCHAFISSRVSA
jgi:hypothetical protein